MSSVHSAMGEPPLSDWFLTQIRSSHGYRSFQKSADIQEAIRLIKDIDIWSAVARDLAMPLENLKIDYNLLVVRRNSIVHQADIDPTLPGAITPISDLMVTAAIDLIEKIVEAIQRNI
jgi:hypothetical protein